MSRDDNQPGRVQHGREAAQHIFPITISQLSWSSMMRQTLAPPSQFTPVLHPGAVLFPEDGHSAVIGFTKTVCFLANMHTFEFMVVQQMIAAVFELVDSIEFNVAEWAHPGLVGTDSDQLREGEQGACHGKILSHDACKVSEVVQPVGQNILKLESSASIVAFSADGRASFFL